MLNVVLQEWQLVAAWSGTHLVLVASFSVTISHYHGNHDNSTAQNFDGKLNFALKTFKYQKVLPSQSFVLCNIQYIIVKHYLILVIYTIWFFGSVVVFYFLIG